MRLGRVMGMVTLSQYDPSYHAGRWLVVRPLDRADLLSDRGPGRQPSLVVYDNLGAGEGDMIAFTEGGEAAVPFAVPTPVDAYNAAIIDKISYHPPTGGAQ